MPRIYKPWPHSGKSCGLISCRGRRASEPKSFRATGVKRTRRAPRPVPVWTPPANVHAPKKLREAWAADWVRSNRKVDTWRRVPGKKIWADGSGHVLSMQDFGRHWGGCGSLYQERVFA